MNAHMLEFDFSTGLLQGTPVLSRIVTLADLGLVFRDEPARLRMDAATVVYRVHSFQPVSEDTQGGLFWGTTAIEPGIVGDEYFMTRGHFHAKRESSEYYATLHGEGALILMDEDRQTCSQPMSRGSLHYIPGKVAHRVVNTGSEPLVFCACWPSDAGHDYQSIASAGFSVRMRRRAGVPTLVEEP